MKLKTTLLILVAFVISFTARATHLMGGEIVAQQISAYQYQIVMTAYRDTAGIPMQNFASFSITDSSVTNIANLSTSYDSILSGNALPMYPYGL